MARRSGKIRQNPDPSRPSWGAATRLLRKGQNLSQEKLAELAGLHKQRISEIENGRVTEPHAETLYAIAVGLGYEFEEMHAKACELSLKHTDGGHTIHVGRDVIVNIDVNDGSVDRGKLLGELQRITGLEPDQARRLLEISQPTISHTTNSKPEFRSFFLSRIWRGHSKIENISSWLKPQKE
jgi:transcriptional regulator with XRE-family HTH domain